jgi:hypothetical protein
VNEDKVLIDLALLSHIERVVDDRIAAHQKENEGVVKEIHQRFDNLEKLIKAGFPHGDPDSHRRVHEQYIVEATEREKMLKGAKQKVFEMTLWGALVIMVTAVWEYFRVHVNK